MVCIVICARWSSQENTITMLWSRTIGINTQKLTVTNKAWRARKLKAQSISDPKLSVILSPVLFSWYGSVIAAKWQRVCMGTLSGVGTHSEWSMRKLCEKKVCQRTRRDPRLKPSENPDDDLAKDRSPSKTPTARNTPVSGQLGESESKSDWLQFKEVVKNKPARNTRSCPHYDPRTNKCGWANSFKNRGRTACRYCRNDSRWSRWF